MKIAGFFRDEFSCYDSNNENNSINTFSLFNHVLKSFLCLTIYISERLFLAFERCYFISASRECVNVFLQRPILYKWSSPNFGRDWWFFFEVIFWHNINQNKITLFKVSYKPCNAASVNLIFQLYYMAS